jgi:hypothetical protein
MHAAMAVRSRDEREEEGFVGDAVRGETALVAHGYRTAVETAGVHTPHALWQYRHHRAVAPHIVVI